MHGTITTRPNVAIFDKADDMLAAMFGAPQHDRHVTAYVQHLRLKHGYYKTVRMEAAELMALEAGRA